MGKLSNPTVQFIKAVHDGYANLWRMCSEGVIIEPIGNSYIVCYPVHRILTAIQEYSTQVSAL